MCSHNLLVTLRISDRSRCGAVLMLTLFAQPCWQFGFDKKFLTNILPRGLLQRSCQANSYGELAQRSLVATKLLRAILTGFCLTGILRRDPLQRVCIEMSCKDLAKRPLRKNLYKDLAFADLDAQEVTIEVALASSLH